MGSQGRKRRVVIMGAAGRDFHDFNMMYRDDPGVHVVAFSAAQIPNIAGRSYPPELAGPLYPDGIPVVPEQELEALCRREQVDDVLFAYSDIAHDEVMHAASRVLATGASFRLPGPNETMLRATKPVVAVCAVRTGCGKSQTSRYLTRHFRGLGYRVAAIRHPMPYGDLRRQAVQHFTSLADLDAADCTIEEREEYEPYIAIGASVFAGVDYGAILQAAEKAADIILWDGGNNDFSFIQPDVMITLVDALRAEHLTTHHPGEATLRMAHGVVIAKCDTAEPDIVRNLENRLHQLLPGRPVFFGASPLGLENPEALTGKRLLVIEDGPTITHGGMPWGAGYQAVHQLPGVRLLDPRDSLDPALAGTFERYPHIGPVLPAMGYGQAQIAALEATINTSAADVVIAATPIDLNRLIHCQIPIVRVRYEYADYHPGKLERRSLADFVTEQLKPRLSA